MELAILVVAVLAHLGIGLFTFLYRPDSATHRFFLLFAVVSAVWGVANYLSLHQGTPQATLDMIRWVMFFATLHAFSLFLLIHTFPSPTIKLRKLHLALLLLLVSAVLVLTRTPLIFASIEGIGSQASPQPGPAIPLFALTTGSFVLGAIYLLIARYRHSRGVEKAQLQYLMVGVTGSAAMIFLTNFALVVIFGITSLVTLGSSYTLIFIIATAYSIVAHHLFDIRVIIKRTVVYSGLLLFAVMAYSLIIFTTAALFDQPSNFLESRTFVTNLVAASLIAIGFDPLRRRLIRLTDRYLFVGEYTINEVIASLAQTLNNVLDLDEALQSMMKVLTKALRIKRSATFIVRTEKDELVVKRVQSVGYTTAARLTLERNSAFLQYFKDPKNGLIVIEELVAELKGHHHTSRQDLGQQLAEEAEQLNAAVAIPIRVNDKLIGILTVDRKLSGDIFTSEDLQLLDIVAKQTASAIEKSRFYEDDQLKSEFVSIASHELLTPTAAIEGYLSMILDEKMAKVDKKAEDYLRKVQSSAHRLSELVTDLLSVSRIEGGRIVINKRPVEVSPIITSVIDEIKVKADQADIKLTYLAPPKSLPKVLADPDRVAQVLTNLVSNAIKYNKPKGTIEVSVEVDKHFVTIVVVDTGIGIAPNHLPHLFEKFYRVHDDSAAAEKIGTGLGLYITRSIVELMGGRIMAKSQVGKGSTFSFTLPVA